MNRMQSQAVAQQSGFGLIDMFTGMTILTIALVTLATGAVGASRHVDDTNASIVIQSAHRNLVEALKAETMDTLVTNFGPSSGQDTFWCAEDGTLVYTTPSNPLVKGTIEIFDDESLVPNAFAGASGGLDLNGDGSISSGTVANPKMLPVRLVISTGDREVTSCVMISSENP